MDQIKRRSVMAMAAAAPLLGARGAAGVTARGSVFEDATGSSVRPANARGIAGVLVSNGREVVVTDSDGRYEIAVMPGQSVFVIKPSGWMVPVEAGTNVPRLGYVYQPEGTPAALAMRFEGVAPTGPLPDRIDFPLRKQQESDRFDVFLVTDPQPEDANELDYVRDDVIAQIPRAANAAFGVTLGDLMYDDLSLYERHNRIFGTIGVPWFSLPGNHDMNYEAPSRELAYETWKRHFGVRHYAWNWGPVTFVALDNVNWLGGTDIGHYGTDFDAGQLEFVQNLLAHIPRGRLTVFLMHVPLASQLASQSPKNVVSNSADFLKLIAGRNAISFAGHTHTNEHWYLGAERHHHHVLQAASGSWWSGPFDARGIPVAISTDGTPNGFHVLSIDRDSAVCRLVATHEPENAPMRVMLVTGFHSDSPDEAHNAPQPSLNPLPQAQSALAGALLLVNLFEGGPQSEVNWRLNREIFWRAAKRVVMKDPYVAELYARNTATVKSFVKPSESTHLFQAVLPALPPGTHRITVKTRDEYGVAAEKQMIVEVLEG